MKVPKFFIHKTEIPPMQSTPPGQNRFWKLKLTILVLFIIGILASLLYFTNMFYMNYYFVFQSPIVTRPPLILKRRDNKIISPIGSGKTGMVGQIYAQELTPKEMLRQKSDNAFGSDQWIAMDYVITRESNYNLLAINSTSGACGLGQALPCGKLLQKCPNMTDIDCQTDWVISYIRDRYQTPENAMIQEIQNNYY